MNNKYIIILTVFISSLCLNASGQVLYFNGLGRALVTNDGLKGSIIDPNDHSTPRKATGGYTLFDLGVNVQPAEYLRASATLRLRNEFGGFYGDGSSFTFRQMKLEGIIAKKVKYEIGDIDLSLTPYTLFNFNETYYDHEADIFSIRRSIVNYENFNFGNKWRVQGANASTNLTFEKGIERIGLRAFATRLRRANYFTKDVPDRIQYGGRFDILQSKYFQIGANYIAQTDIAGTSPQPALALDNKVATGDIKINIDMNKAVISFYGEGGGSKLNYTNFFNDSLYTRSKEDYFFDGGVSFTYKPLNLKVFANYRNVGAAFNSPGAQTRRVFDNGAPSVFPTYSVGSFTAGRAPVLFDRYTDEGAANTQNTRTIRNTTILDTLVSYNPKYNNITPYGIATPNRQGFTFGASIGEDDKIIKADVAIDMLGEVLGEVNNGTRKYVGYKGGVNFNIHKLVKFEKMIVLTGGIRNEHTTRNSVANKIDLTSNLIDAGILVEILKGFDLLAGYKTLIAKGNEIIPVRDALNQPNTSSLSIYNFNSTESALALGARYRFSKNSYATLQWHQQSFDNKLVNSNYKIKQLFINYTMIF